MRIAIVVEASEGVANKTWLVQNLSAELAEYFSDKDYGEDVEEIIIGIISVAPEFEFFSKIRKPRYKAYREYVNRDGLKIIEDRLFSFSLKIDYESLKNQTDEENRKMLASEILGSLSNLDALPKKVKDFDKERFKEDMIAFFEEQKLLVKK